MTSLPPPADITLPPKREVVEPDVRLAPWRVPEYTGPQKKETLKIPDVPIHLVARLRALQVLAPKVNTSGEGFMRRTWPSMLVEALEYGILTMEKKYGKV